MDQILGHADKSGNWGGWHLHFECLNAQGKLTEPLTVIHKYQPQIKYRIMSGKWHEPVKEVFRKYNPTGLKIIKASQGEI